MQDKIKIKPKPRIVCAANITPRGALILGVRHFDEFMRTQIKLMGEHHIGCKQGFVDQFGKFYTREEALVIAKENDQIIRRCGGDEKKLYSENLY